MIRGLCLAFRSMDNAPSTCPSRHQLVHLLDSQQPHQFFLCYYFLCGLGKGHHAVQAPSLMPRMLSQSAVLPALPGESVSFPFLI